MIPGHYLLRDALPVEDARREYERTKQEAAEAERARAQARRDDEVARASAEAAQKRFEELPEGEDEDARFEVLGLERSLAKVAKKLVKVEAATKPIFEAHDKAREQLDRSEAAAERETLDARLIALDTRAGEFLEQIRAEADGLLADRQRYNARFPKTPIDGSSCSWLADGPLPRRIFASPAWQADAQREEQREAQRTAVALRAAQVEAQRRAIAAAEQRIVEWRAHLSRGPLADSAIAALKGAIAEDEQALTRMKKDLASLEARP